MWCFVSLFLAVSTSAIIALVLTATAIDCLERLGLQNHLLCVQWDVKLYTLTDLLL